MKYVPYFTVTFYISLHAKKNLKQSKLSSSENLLTAIY